MTVGRCGCMKERKNGHAARISFGPDFIVDDGSIQATFLHPLENVILERVQLAGAGYLSLVGNRLRFLQPLSDGFSISPQFLGNLCNAHSSFSHLMDHVKLPILDHVVSLLRGESAVKVGNFQPVILGILTPFSTYGKENYLLCRILFAQEYVERV